MTLSLKILKELLRNAPPKVQRVAALKLLIALEQKSFEGVEI